MLFFCSINSLKLTTSKIVSALEHNGIELFADTSHKFPSVTSRTLNNVTPNLFQLDEHQLISIYIYSSQKEAQSGLKQHNLSTILPSKKHSVFQVNNSLVFYIGNDLENEKKIGQAMDSLLKKE